MRFTKLSILPFLCLAPALKMSANPSASTDRLTDFRVRNDFQVPLNANIGWAADINESAQIIADQPFRIRVQITNDDPRDSLRHYVLWYRRNEETWQPVVDADFPYPAYASPTVSLIEPPYATGSATEDLLPQNVFEHGEDGAGQGLAPVSTRAGEGEVASEWEFPLVIRYYADGPICIDNGDTFEFRISHLHGGFLPAGVTPNVVVTIPSGHLGGTFVETPGRIGPWTSTDGNLYFIMEPTETDNRFMMVKSIDDGASWQEIDGNHRPPARDLEAVDTFREGDLLHILHMEDEVWYHSFRMSASEQGSEGWVTRSELVARPDKPPVQSVGMEILEDGTMLGFHANGPRIQIRTRTKEGSWDLLHEKVSPIFLSGIQTTSWEDYAFLAYTEGNGKAWLQIFNADGPIGNAFQLSSGIGTFDADACSILPLVFIPERQELAIVYREIDGSLYERRLRLQPLQLSDAHRIIDGPVVQNAVDSDQTGADLVAAGNELHLLYIPEANRGIFHTKSTRFGTWSEPQQLIENIQASWLRAHARKDGKIGFVYDAGSLGGSGMNRYFPNTP
jgi:hypothetical protein